MNKTGKANVKGRGHIFGQKDSIRSKKKKKILSTQRYLDFAGVHDDTLILKNGGIRTIVEVSSINFNLKSEDEQNSIIYAYQRFLNSLNFPIQISVKSRKLDIDNYLEDMRMRMKVQKNDLLKNQMGEYIEYIQKLVEFSDIMEKRFFVIIPQNPARAEKKSVFRIFLDKISPDDKVIDVISRKKEFKVLKKRLEEKDNIVKTGLTNCGLTVKVLTTEKIIELFYQSYNPQLSRTQKINSIEDLAMAKNAEDNLIPNE
jgi:hypothetical protein